MNRLCFELHIGAYPEEAQEAKQNAVKNSHL